jgi:hypothetical protein
MRDDSLMTAEAAENRWKPEMSHASRAWRAPAVVAALVFAVAAAAQSPQPAPKAAAPAKAAPAAKKTAPAQYKPEIEPRALDLLKAMIARLAAAKSMSFTAIVGYEYPSKLGPPIVYTTRYDVTMQRPDRLRIMQPGDGPVSEFYYDGKSMIAYAPAENLAAVVDAPSTVEAMLNAAYKNYALFYPFTDLLLTDPFAVFNDGVVTAFAIGPSAVVGGTRTDMVAWANKDVFLQIWIGADDKLPRRIRAVFAADTLGARHEMEISNWKLDDVIAPDAFTSAKAAAAGRMAFSAPKLPPKGVKPLALDKQKSAVAAKTPAKAN